MAITSQRSLMAPDIMYFVTFLLGMGAFWLSGRGAAMLPQVASRGAATAMNLLVTTVVYGGILAIWSNLTSRGFNLKRTLLAAIPAVVLGMGAAQLLMRLAAGRIHNMTDLGLFTFGLFVCYGIIYTLCLAMARRFAQ